MITEHAASSEDSHVPRWATLLVALVAGAAVLAGLALISRYNYLLFHALIVMASVGVSWAVFGLAWNARRYRSEDN
ncbi:MAG: hypothetical protein H5T69_16550, partial [Chloroflexi bacterium]|nr:hypothetical protein [Chloroflexota bacterium]